ncbi:hypothetical protein JP0568_07130 [Helicobacter pylori]|nr:hypothetical protein FIM60_05855 [Helicobacter pylori]
MALLLIIQTNKGSKTLHFKLPQPKEEDLVSSLVKAFLNQSGWIDSLFYFFNFLKKEILVTLFASLPELC